VLERGIDDLLDHQHVNDGAIGGPISILRIVCGGANT